MGIQLFVEPRVAAPWQEFVDGKRYGEKSIALDGYVNGPPVMLLGDGTLKANFDHHCDVNRLATRSTSGQVQLALRLGLGPLLDGTKVFVNDCDQDTCLAVWLLQNAKRTTLRHSEPLINRLVWAEDALDSTGGAYPIDPDSDLMWDLTWIFEPYQQARAEGRVSDMTSNEMLTLIEAVCGRISSYTLGDGDAIRPDLRYDVIGGGPGWSMVHEVGFSARTGLFASGTKAFVAVEPMADNRWLYKIGRMSPFVQFPLPRLYVALNTAEIAASGDGPGWGGSDLIGGGPRNGSCLTPQRVQEVVNNGLQLG
jgi:hypothetical protein